MRVFDFGSSRAYLDLRVFIWYRGRQIMKFLTRISCYLGWYHSEIRSGCWEWEVGVDLSWWFEVLRNSQRGYWTFPHFGYYQCWLTLLRRLNTFLQFEALSCSEFVFSQTARVYWVLSRVLQLSCSFLPTVDNPSRPWDCAGNFAV
jgi:hypothetical protein